VDVESDFVSFIHKVKQLARAAVELERAQNRVKPRSSDQVRAIITAAVLRKP
jgi:hypothetical protein